MQNFHQSHVSKVAIKRRRWPLAGFLDRMDGKDQRDAAAIANAVTNTFDDLQVDVVARRQFTAGLGDPDDGSAGSQLFARDAEIKIALQVHSGHTDVVWVVKPHLATQLLLWFFSHLFVLFRMP